MTTQGWDYTWRVVDVAFSIEKDMIAIRDLGADGWELISTAPGRDIGHVVFIFKRPLTDQS